MRIPWRSGLGLRHSLTGMASVMNSSGMISVPNNFSHVWVCLVGGLTFRMSPPSKWLRISTNLFQQSVSAYRQGVLQLKTLKTDLNVLSPPTAPFLCRILLNNRFHATIPGTCLLGAIHYLTIQLKNLPSRDNPALPRNPVLPLAFLSPAAQVDDLFSSIQEPPKPPSLTNPRALYS